MSFEVFVPGRLCILGEHSDWAAQYRAKNNEVMIGLIHISQLLAFSSSN